MRDGPATIAQSSPVSLKGNIAANFAGTLWQALMGLIFVPLYIRFMGIESYGLIGIFSTLQITLGLLDLGLGSTLTRGMARLSALPDKEQEMRNLVRTLETIYWSVALIVGVAVVSTSPFIAHHWVKAGELSPGTVEQALFIMGFLMVFQMPIGFYSGGLLGLQKQVLLNVINVCMSTLRGGGAVLILWLVSPTIQAFFLWQIAISILHAFTLAVSLWRSVPRSGERSAFEKRLLKESWRFAAGMSGISIFSTILTQLDKVILSKVLPLEMFGYYMLASVVAGSLARLFTPVFFSIYPRFIQLASVSDMDGLARLYHKCSQFMAVLILPVAVIIALYSYDLILFWTQNQETAERTHLLVSILISGTAINGLMNPPYALQLAFGWTRLSFFKTLIAVILVVPLIIYMTTHYGATGAAVSWLVLNIGMFLVEIPIMHLRLLRNEKWRWYLQDVSAPLAAAFAVACAGRYITGGSTTQLMTLVNLGIVSVVTLGVVGIATPVSRTWLFTHLAGLRRA